MGSSGCLPCLLDTLCSSSHTPRETEAWGLLRDRMSSCDPTYLGIKATGQVRGVGGCGGRRKPGGEVPRGRRQWGPAVPRQGVVWKSGGRLWKERCLLGWGGVGTEEGLGFLCLGHTAPAPTCSICTPTARGQLPPARWQFLQRFDGSQSHVQCSGRKAAGPPDPKPQGGQAG